MLEKRLNSTSVAKFNTNRAQLTNWLRTWVCMSPDNKITDTLPFAEPTYALALAICSHLHPY
ncbi:hypothetical protein CRE_16759 [Caenorhabditis remanei]|uniref:Uncharacterized protein n=1 Tax=Caenorhabditis remanei TaxID=31234 RepID=E3MAV3_CAERE|nr:hypothetical protein CRE_16759 [Caenorhabditis remanei]